MICMSDTELQEIRGLLERIQEEQVLSGLDSVLLLLLPLTTFLFSVTPILLRLSRFIAFMSDLLAVLFASVLIVLVIGKVKGSDSIRIVAWFMFILFSVLFAIFSVYNGILGIVIGGPITVSPLFLGYYILGEAISTVGVAYPPIACMRRTIESRLPTRRAEIERAYHFLWKDKIADYYLIFIIGGFSSLIYSTAWGVTGVPTYLHEPLNIVSWICAFAFFALVIIRWILKKRSNRRRAALTLNRRLNQQQTTTH